MPIGNLSGKISSDDMNTVNKIRNPPDYDPDFSGKETADDDLEFEFDTLDDDFFSDTPSSNSEQSGNSSVFSGDNNASVFGNSGGTSFGGSQFGGSGSLFGGQSLGNTDMTNKQDTPKPDTFDKLIDFSGDAMLSFGSVLKEVVKSIKNRNSDDIAYLARNMIITGGIASGVSILFIIIALIYKIKFLGLQSMGGCILIAGICAASTGTGLMALALLGKLKSLPDSEDSNIESLTDMTEEFQDDCTFDFEEISDDIFEDAFSDLSSEDLFGSEEQEEDTFKVDNMSAIEAVKEELNISDMVDSIPENQILTRKILFNTFKDFFPTNTPEFVEKTYIEPESNLFSQIETICLKALANVARKDLSEITTSVESICDGFFSYEIKLKRVKGITKTSEIARELEAYFREDSKDYSVNASVDIESDYYKIVVTKGVQAIITVGDMLKIDKVKDFILNEKNRLPIIAGISSYGEVITADAKVFDTMVVTGKPRSGKSWLVLSLLMSFMAFNSPEDVQFIIIDPKDSNVFNTMSLMPHVCGLHTGLGDINILDILKDIIENEGKRRAKLLKDNKCDDIWALRDKGIKLPILYLFIDEVMTLQSQLGEQFKEFLSMLKEMISKLPYVGIRVILIPHRLTGLIDKTNRTMLHFAAAVKADATEVEETLNIKGWTTPLVNNGDIAIKMQNRPDAIFVKGPAVTISDAKNTELILNIARAFYKMGVDLPDMSTLQYAVNRDEDRIREELSLNNNRVQYDAKHIFDDIDD